jgi:hypothetical protein
MPKVTVQRTGKLYFNERLSSFGLISASLGLNIKTLHFRSFSLKLTAPPTVQKQLQ